MELNNEEHGCKRVLLTGGTGFIGTKLTQELLSLNCDLTILTRNLNAVSDSFKEKINFITDFSQISNDSKFDVIINLAGEPLAKKRWTEKRKAIFIESRLTTTSNICELIERLQHKPEVLINGSAIGYYGPNQDDTLDESGRIVDCFSHDLCRRWEEQALKAESSHTRVCLLRTGIVLGDNGGPLAELRLPFEFGVAMQISDGKQWMSWIHRDDLVSIIIFAMNESTISGPINGTAPNPVTNEGFTDLLNLHFKTFLKIKFPRKLLSLVVGELADEVLITGQKVIPSKLENSGFIFKYPQLTSALTELIGQPLK